MAAYARMSMQKKWQLSCHADLVVVGAGMCGVSFARHAAEAGKRVVLLEANLVGSGMTGSSAGHVMTGFYPSPAQMISKIGAIETLRLQRWSHESKLALRSRWIDLGLGDSITDGYLLVARTGDEREVLEDIAAYWCDQLGVAGVRIIAGSSLAGWIRSPTVDSALYDPSGFRIDPPTLVKGLRRLASHELIDVQERTKVLRVSTAGERHRVETTLGMIMTDQVVLCTGANQVELLGCMEEPAIGLTTTVVAITEPIPRDVLRETLPFQIAGSDCSHAPDYWTPLRDGRLLFGCSETTPAKSLSNTEKLIRVRYQQLFPRLAGYEFKHVYSAFVDQSDTGLPETRMLASGCHISTGYSGVGLATSYGAGKQHFERV
ncbi:MAG: NAD(P)/FAD-dependent oxidoreductase [Hyphomicrobiaceae bacterium]